MKVRDLINRLRKLDPEREIWIGYDFPHDVQEPDFVEYGLDDIPSFLKNEIKIKLGDYIHFAE